MSIFVAVSLGVMFYVSKIKIRLPYNSAILLMDIDLPKFKA